MRITFVLPWLACIPLALAALAEALPTAPANEAPSTRESKVLSAKREVSQRQVELDKALRKGDATRIDQSREQLANARKTLQQAVDDLDP